MATRATYQIAGKTFYCHWDGYPEGAALRFAKMIAALTVPDPREAGLDVIEERRGGAPFAFIRGNMDAEPISSHDEIGGTEWRYTVEPCKAHGLTVRASRRHPAWSEPEQWEAAPPMPLAEFVAMHGKAFDAPPVCVARFAESWNPPQLATVEHARTIAAAYRAQAERFAEGNPNRASYFARAEAWQEAAGPAPEPSAGIYRPELADAFRQGARDLCGDRIHVDADARVEESEGDGGAIVHCTIFVSDDERANMKGEACDACGEAIDPEAEATWQQWQCGACGSWNDKP